MFGHIDSLAVPHTGKDRTRMMPQIPKANGMRIRCHAANVSQKCGTY